MSPYYNELPTAGMDEEEESLEVSILKSEEEDGDSVLCAIEDQQELETVYELIMQQLYEDESDEE